MSNFGTVTDYTTGKFVRTATATEWRKTADKENSGQSDAYTGAWTDEDGRIVYVSGGPESLVSDVDIEALALEAGEAGDAEQAQLCDMALAPFATAGPDVELARARCVRVILDNRMRVAD